MKWDFADPRTEGLLKDTVIIIILKNESTDMGWYVFFLTGKIIIDETTRNPRTFMSSNVDEGVEIIKSLFYFYLNWVRGLIFFIFHSQIIFLFIEVEIHSYLENYVMNLSVYE